MSFPGPDPSAPENPFQSAAPSPSQRGSRTWLWLAACGAVAAMCLCSGLCVVPMGMGVYQAVAERDDVERVVTAFMSEMGAGKFAEASGRFSSRAKRISPVSPEQLAKLGDKREFQGGRAAHVSGVNLNRSFNSNPDIPQGIVANVSGTIDYEAGGHGTFRATLEKEDGEWRLHSINVQRAGQPSVSPAP